MIETFNGYSPKIHERAWVHPRAVVIGNVEIDEGANIWPGAVLRGDMGAIRIGKNTSIQDGTVCHMTQGFSNTIIGANCTVGHGVILHGCIVGEGSLIGMGSIILDETRIGDGSFVAAGSLVTGNKTFEPETFICGSPAKALRAVSERERQMCEYGVKSYLELVERYRG